MATNSESEKVLIGIGNEIIELTGQAKIDFIADREALFEAERLLESEQLAKKQLRESAIRQLAETANLSEEQIEALLG